MTFLRDGRYWVFMALGPIAWFIYAIVFEMRPNGDWMKNHAWQFVMLTVVYPILEEWVFRGVFQPLLLKQEFGARTVAQISVANIITSVVFALLHALRQPVLWAASVFIPSLIFGYCRERYQTILPGVILHIFYNAGFVGMFYGVE